MSDVFYIVDTSTLEAMAAQGGQAGLDRLLLPGSRVILTERIVQEMQASPYASAFNEWYAAHASADKFASDLITLNVPLPSGYMSSYVDPEAAERALLYIAQEAQGALASQLSEWMANTSGIEFMLLADEAGFFDFMLSELQGFTESQLDANNLHAAPYAGSVEFYNDLLRNARIAKSVYNAYRDYHEEAEFIAAFAKQGFLNAKEVDDFNLQNMIDLGIETANDVSPNTEFSTDGFKILSGGRTAFTLKAVRESGLQGDPLTIETSLNLVYGLVETGKIEAANRFLTSLLFQVGGGLVMRWAIGLGVERWIKQPFAELYTDVLDVITKIDQKQIGAEIGRQVYDQIPGFFDFIYNQVYSRIDFDADFSARVFSELISGVFGLSLNTQPATEGDDLLTAAKWAQIDGDDGNDIIFGAFGEILEAGEEYYEGNPDSETTPGERRMVLNGGGGNDWVVSILGEGTVTAGGVGNDWIINTSAGGIIYGDTFDGLSEDGKNINDEVRENRGGDLAQQTADNFFFFPDTVIMDPGHNDTLRWVLFPLIGGSNELPGLGFGMGGGLLSYSNIYTFLSPIYFDQFFPWITYVRKDGDLFVLNIFDQIMGRIDPIADFEPLKGVQVIKNYESPVSGFFGATYYFASAEGGEIYDALTGDLGMFFKNANPILALLSILPMPGLGGLNRFFLMIDNLLGFAAFVNQFIKRIGWTPNFDPLVLDLDGDGIETISLEDAGVYFDLDNDLFAERTAWIAADDGILVRDANGNGEIDNIDEMFGGEELSGFAELAEYDVNGDGVIDAADAIYSELQVWRDLDQDGRADDGELFYLTELGIRSISVESEELGAETPQGVTLDRIGEFTWETGEVGRAFDAIFEMSDVDTRFVRENGTAEWLAGAQIDSRGFGRLTDLSVAMSNDFELAEIVTTAAAAMTTPDLKILREQSAEALGQWGFSLEATRELAPVLLQTESDGAVTLLDRGVWTEDETGGYWTLASGAPVIGADGQEVARPTLDDILAQSMIAGAEWRMEQVWSPASRAEALEHREAAPYLATKTDDRTTILDYGVQNEDGSWRLASGADVLDADGLVIAAPTREDILAMAAPDGAEWREEELGFNPYAAIPVENIGVYLIDGIVVDYTVEVTDQDGSFYVWARNLDRALELQDKFGTPRDFNLRYYEVDFETLDEVGSTDDSTYRVELLTPGQFHFATSLIGVDFQPAMLSANIDQATGVIDYSVNETGRPSLEDGEYVSGIKPMIELLDAIMDQYVIVSRAFAVKMAMQGGLSSYFEGITYDNALDVYYANQDRELAPVYEAIFADAPAGFDPAYDYLVKWSEILVQIYPDYKIDGTGNVFGAAVNLDQKFILQNLIPAFENVGIDLDMRAVMNAMALNETLLRDHDAAATEVVGTSGVDFIYATGGDQIYKGGTGEDTYFIGGDWGVDIIEDIDFGDADEIRFTSVTSEQITARREGQDLLLYVEGEPNHLTVKNHFLGELNPSFGKTTQDTAMKSILFADGVIWDQFTIAVMVSDPKDTDDIIIGSGALDILEGGKGNDILEGGLGGDMYLIRPGDGQDVIFDGSAINRLPSKAGIDFVQFLDGIKEEDLVFKRDGESDDLQIYFLDENGEETGQRVIIEKQFDGIVLNLGDFLGQFDPSLDIDYIAPSLIERFTFDDGSALDFEDVKDEVLANAKTDGEDPIFGFLTADTLDGGAGDDLLVGREGDDVYRFGADYGLDVMYDGDESVDLFGTGKINDRLVFGDGLTWADFDFSRDGAGDTITMMVKGTEDGVILRDIFLTGIFQGFINLIDYLEFSDGTEWHYTKLAQHMVDIARTDGDDVIYGWFLPDRIDGGLGDDRLEGFGGSDVYSFSQGYGQDTIFDTGGGGDRLSLTDIAFADVDVSRDGVDLIIDVTTTGERVVIEDQYYRYEAQGRAIETFDFADGEIDYIFFNPHVMDVVGDSGDDYLAGSDFSEIIDGRDGDDTLVGGSDGDIYKWDVGYGADLIIDKQVATAWKNRKGGKDKETDDRIQFGGDVTIDNVTFTKDGNDLVISVVDRVDTLRIRNQFASIEEGVEYFDFFDGTTWHISDVEERLAIVGGNRGDNLIEGSLDQPNVLDGRQGDDTLVGGREGDIYAFGAAYDLDVIIERADGTPGAVDRLVFGSTVSVENVTIRRLGDDLIFDLGNGEDQLTVQGGLGAARIEEYLFADGTTLTFDDIQERLLQGTDGDDLLIGFDGRNDTIIGGEGSDAAEGGTGDDTYHYDSGFGDDAITDTGGVDVVSFGPGLRAVDVRFTTEKNNLIITFEGHDDSLVILGGANLSAPNRAVETFRFDEGVEISMEDVWARLVQEAATPSNDIIDARIDRPVAFDASGGADVVYLGGDATFTFGAGHGLASVDTASSTGGDRIIFENLNSSDARVRRDDESDGDWTIMFLSTGDQLTLLTAVSGATTPTMVFADGVEWGREELAATLVASQITGADDLITASKLNDVIEAGAGDDDIQGGNGNDVYIFRRGDGQDVIADWGGADRLEIYGYLPEDVSVSRVIQERDEVVLTFAGTEDQIILRYSGGVGVDEVVFSDGTVWDQTHLFAVSTSQGTDYSDTIVGSPGEEVIEGGGGDDTLEGGAGSDVYEYGRDDGNDVIYDYDPNIGVDRLKLLDFAPFDIRLSATLNDIIITMPTGNTVTLKNHRSDSRAQIEEIEFVTGEVWGLQAISDRLWADMYDAGYVVGTTGFNTYNYRKGDGSFAIYDYQQYSGEDRLILHDTLLSEVTWVRDGNDYVIRIDNGEEIRLINQGLNDDWGVRYVRFADGTEWQRGSINNALVAQQLEAGADTIYGSVEFETYYHDKGDGSYAIRDYEQYSGEDRLILRDTLLSEVTWVRDGNDYVIRIDNGEEIRLINQGLNDDWGVRYVRFADGTEWQRGSINNALVAQQLEAGADTIYGSVEFETYYHDKGDGSYAIRDYEQYSGEDRLILRDTLLSEVTWVRDGNDYVIRIDNGEEIRLINQGLNDDWGVRYVRFADGTEWQRGSINNALVAQQLEAGADTIYGSVEFETYYHDKGDGSYAIRDYEQYSGEDRLILRDTLPDELIVSREGNDFVLNLDNGEQIRLINQVSNDDWGVRYVRFADGTEWQRGTLFARVVTDAKFTGRTEGTSGDEIYTHTLGDGSHTIADPGGADRLVLTDQSSVGVTATRAGADMILNLPNGEAITLERQFDGNSAYWIETIEFSDGVLWRRFEFDHRVQAAAKATGLVTGDTGNQTYIHLQGDGSYAIEDYNYWRGSDTLQLADALPADIIVTRDGMDALLTVGPDTIRLIGQLEGDNQLGVENITFSDGSAWARATLRGLAIPAEETPPNVVGTTADEAYIYTLGDGTYSITDYNYYRGSDSLTFIDVNSDQVGFSRSGNNLIISLPDGEALTLVSQLDENRRHSIETISFADGVALNEKDVRDRLVSDGKHSGRVDGTENDESYVHYSGDGAYRITDYDYYQGNDTLTFADLASTDATFGRSGNDLLISFSNGDQVRVVRQLDDNLRHGVETVTFSDGVVMGKQALRDRMVSDLKATGSVIGSERDESYFHNAGDGSYSISDYDYYQGNDRLTFNDLASTQVTVTRTSNDVVMTFDNGEVIRLVRQLDENLRYGMEAITFSDGVTWDKNQLRDRMVSDMKATGSVVGSERDENYFHNAGDGSYSISDYDYYQGNDRLTFNDLASTEVTVTRTSNDVVMTFDNGEVIRLVRQLDDNLRYGMEAITFSDGVTWDKNQLRDRMVSDMKATGSVVGSERDENYFHNAGDGSYSISDYDYYQGNDRLTFNDLASTQVTVTRTSNDVVMTFDNGEVIRLVRQLDDNLRYGMEAITFSDGVTWDKNQLRDRMVSDMKATGSVVGSERDENYFHASGDGSYSISDYDYYAGNDRLTFSDLLPQQIDADRSGNDVILNLPGDETIRIIRQLDSNNRYGMEAIIFADGSTWDRAKISDAANGILDGVTFFDGTPGADTAIGTDGPDVIELIEGEDFASGGLGGDTYVFNRGDGIDVIRDAGEGTDIIEIRGFTRDQVTFDQLGRGGADLIIRFEEAGDQITVINGLLTATADRVEQVYFRDTNETVTILEIEQALLHGRQDDAGNTILGNDLANTLTGGEGSDLLVGLGGDDTYIYRAGDGDDRINDDAQSTGDRLVFEDYNVSDLLFVSSAGVDGNDLVFRFAAGEDRVIITNGLRTGWYDIETIEFADGTTWGLGDSRAATIQFASTDFDDVIRGFSSDDAIAGGLGDDQMFGGGGNDVYAYAAGDGADTITDTGGADRLEISGYISAEASVDRLYKGSDTIVISFAGSDDTITITDLLTGSVEEIAFGDGVIWDAAKVLELLDNRAPVTQPDGIFAGKQEETLILSQAQLLANDFDADGDPLTVIAVDGGAHGVAEIDVDGNIRFTPNVGYYGPARITYTVSDGRNGLAEGTADIRVAPLAFAKDDEGFTVEEDGYLAIETTRLLSNDVDGDRMIVSSVFNAVNGNATLLSNGEISFIPDPDFNGLAQFTYAANTPEGGRAEAVVYVNVTPVNDAPVARDNSGFATLEDQPFIIAAASLLGNDSDIDGDALTVTGVTGSLNVQVSLSDDGIITVTPAPYFFGNAFFEYEVSDEAGLTDTARVNLYVEPVNNTPEPQDDVLSGVEDNFVLTAAADLLANDIERDGDALTISSVGGAVGGRVELLENQTVLFTPHANFFGQGGYRYTVDDGQGGTASAWVTVNVEAVNDAPVSRADGYWMNGLEYLRGLEDTAIEIPLSDLLLNDYDVEGDAIQFETFSDPLNGDIELTTDGTIIFTPDQDYWGAASFNYVISDEHGLTDGTTVTLYFDNVGDAPPVVGDDTVQVIEDIPQVIRIEDLLANDTDIDRDTLEFVGYRYPSIFEPDLNGVLSYNEDGDILFTPDLNSDESYGFYYTITDNADGTAEGFVDIQMIAVNDDPEAQDDDGWLTWLDVPMVIRISSILENDADIEDNPIFFARVEAATAGTAEVYNDEFIVVRFGSGYVGDETLTYSINDPQGLEDTAFIFGEVQNYYLQRQVGSDLRDLIIGNHLDEELLGQGGADDIYGEGGVDSIYGGFGDDLIYAGDGDDVVDGGAGDDDIFGEAGDDLILGGDGFDDIDGGEGFDIVDLSGSNIGVRADLGSRIGQGGYAQGDIYTSVEALIGTSYSDTLGGDETANRLEGAEGRDILEGRGGVDSLFGGADDDTFEGGAGGDFIYGGTGSDTADYFLSSAAVSISLLAGTASGGDAEGDLLSSIENLIGSDFNDVLTGDGWDNLLRGRRGDDLIDAGAGDDILIGGRGADSLFGGAGVDVADYTLSLEGVSINMVDGTAGGGDALGDVFAGIEIVQGSYHDDTIIGDGSDNIIRGGRGADIIDGGAGFDIADYTTADEGVALDLAAGTGTAGEALGDQLSNIEMVRGSNFIDTITGSAGADIIDGGFGDDLIAGGFGSDEYRFGFDSSSDIVTELGDAADTDRVVMADVYTKDASVIREGDDLLLELERDDGFLIDTLRVTDHFIGRETGIEEIVFADGTVWDRATMENMVRAGRFNAEDDVYAFGYEDVVAVISTADLIENDATEGLEFLEVISVQDGVDGEATLIDGDTIHFLGAPDHYGNAFFEYTVRDQFGRESTARVRVNLEPVNDNPVAENDGVFEGTEDEILQIRIADLLANDSDVDGDSLSIVALDPLYDLNGDPLYSSGQYRLTNGKGGIGSEFISFEPRPDHSGFAGFTYTISDGNGGTATGEVELFFHAVNDAPRGTDDKKTVRLTQTATFTEAELLSNDTDPEGDAILFQGVHSPVGGTLIVDPVTGEISFTPDALGTSTFKYDVIDEHGAPATFTVEINTIPLNDPPVARNDGGFETYEDEVIIIDPAALLANDSDPNGDIITVSGLERFPTNGKVAFTEDGMIAFTPRADYNGQAGFVYEIADEEGLTDTAFVAITVIPRNDGPVLFDDITEGFEDLPMTFLAAEAFGNDYDPEGDVLFFSGTSVLGVLNQTYNDRSEHQTQFELTADKLDAAVVATATLADGSDLPEWLTFDADTLTISGVAPVDQVDPVEVLVTLTMPAPLAGDPDLTHQAAITVAPEDFAALETGVTLDADVALFDASAGTFSARLFNYRPLPEWLKFDAETMTLAMSDIPPAADAEVARVRIEFTPDPVALPNGTYASSEGGFALEFVIDPTVGVDASVNDLLDTPDFFAAQGLFAVPLGGLGEVSALKENFANLPAWMEFDAEALTFTGTPPELYIGAVPVRLDVAASEGSTAFSIISDVVVDDTFSVSGGGGFSNQIIDGGERIALSRPEDFNGAYAITYDARDEKDGFSEAPAIVVVNVIPMPETPDAGNDFFAGVEDEPLFFTLADLMANDKDDDGHAIRAIAIDQPGNGDLDITEAEVVIPVPADLPVLTGGTYSAMLAGGAALPYWMAIDAATGEITATVPLDILQTLDIDVTVTDGTTTETATVTQLFDGNDGVAITYNPAPSYSGIVQFTYEITDDSEGNDVGTVTIDLAPVNDPPVARDDRFDGLEATPLVLTFDDVTSNDFDVDGDPLTVTSVFGAVNGTVEIVEGEIVFTPQDDWDGVARFDYVVSDGGDGEDVGRVTIDVAPTNEAPVAVTDVFDGFEDTPLVITRAELLANDYDNQADDTPTFVRMASASEGVRFLNLPNGDIQLLTDLDWNGQATFTYEITDGREVSTGTIIYNVAPVNDAPIVQDESGYLTDEDTAFIIPLSELIANDTDVEGDSFYVSRVFDGDNGTVEIVGGNAVFTPRADYFGNARFKYGVTDEHGAESIGTLSLTVLPTDDFPIAVADLDLTLAEDTFLDIDPAILLANDYDPDGGPVSFVGFEASAYITANADGTYRFTPDADFNGAVTLAYTIEDSGGWRSTGTARFEVTPVGDDPVASDDFFSGVEDQTLTILGSQLTANDAEVDGEALIVRSFANLNGIEEVAFDGLGGITVTPTADRFGIVSFDYVVEDSSGATDTGTVRIELAGVNDAPVVETPPDLTGTEDEPFFATIDRALISDIDTAPHLLDISVRQAGGAALPMWLVFDASQMALAGTPPQDFNGDVALELAVWDGDTEVVRPFTLTIDPVNDAPVAVDDALNAGLDEVITIPLANLLANDIDVDGDALQIIAVADGPGFTAELDGNGNAVITRDPSLGGQISVGYTVSDGVLVDEGAVVIDLDIINRPPVVNEIADVHVDEDNALSFAFPADTISDPDGDDVSVTVTRAGGFDLPAWLTFDEATQTLSGTPPQDFNGVLELEVTAADYRISTTRAFNLVVDPVNDAPVFLAPFSDRYSPEDETFDIALQTGLSEDVDGDALTWDVTLEDGTALPGWLAFDPVAFSLSGTPPQDFNGDVGLRITVTDGIETIADTFNLTVTPVNDAPVLLSPLSDRTTDDAGAALQTGIPFTITAETDNFADVDGQTLGFLARLADGTPLPDWLTFDGTSFTGNAPRTDAGVWEIELRATDGVEEAFDVFTISLEERNSAPVAMDDVGFTVSIPDILDIDFAELLANDSDFDGDALTITAVTNGANGEVVLNDGFLTYIPDLTFEGEDQFTYEVYDGFETSTATVTVDVENDYDDVLVADDDGDRLNGGGGDDLLVGGDGDDRLNGGTGDDSIDGGAGDDRASGGFGDDTIDGGEGDDRLVGGFGDDSILGSEGNDRLFAGGGSDVLDGGTGNDSLFGGFGSDTLLGGDGDDAIFAGFGGDEIDGGAGSDRIFGGRGSDVFTFGEGSGADSIYGFDVARSGRRSFIPGDEVRLGVDGVDSFADLLAFGQNVGGGVLFDFGDGDSLFLSGTQLAALDEDQFTFY